MMPESADTQLLQVLRGQSQEDRFVDLVLAECRLILFEAKVPMALRCRRMGAVHSIILDRGGERDASTCFRSAPTADAKLEPSN